LEYESAVVNPSVSKLGWMISEPGTLKLTLKLAGKFDFSFPG
jgi:hypothetical protein